MVFRVRRRLALLLSTALLVSACGGGAVDNPKDLLISALRALAAQPGVTITLSLDSDEASLRALAGSGGEEVPDEVIGMLPHAAVRISVPLGDQSASESAAFALLLKGEELAGLRVVGSDLYLRADVAGIMEAFGQDPAKLDEVAAMLGQFGMPADSLQGRWLVLRGITDTLNEMSEGESTAIPDLKARQAVERLGGVIADATAVTHVGTDSDGEHLRVQVPLREVYTALLAEMEALGMPTPPGEEMPSVDQIPDQDLPVDLWVKNGSLSMAKLDIRALAALDPDAEPLPEGVTRLGLMLRFESFDGNVEAPGDAAELDLQSIMGALFGFMGGAMGGAMGGMPGMMPGMSGGAGNEEAYASGASGPSMYDEHPDYAQARADYCRQVQDMPEDQRERHFADICP